MCHVIVTCRSMLWTLLSILVAFAELIAFMSPDWLLGFPRSDSGVSGGGVESGEYRPSLGLYSRCLHVGARGVGVSCGPYAGTFGEVASGFWKAAMLFLAAGTLLLGCVACISIFSLCFQSILKKSIFNICGLLQAIAGEIFASVWVVGCDEETIVPDLLQIFSGFLAFCLNSTVETESKLWRKKDWERCYRGSQCHVPAKERKKLVHLSTVTVVSQSTFMCLRGVALTRGPMGGGGLYRLLPAFHQHFQDYQP